MIYEGGSRVFTQQQDLWPLVESLLDQGECEWVEVKHANDDPQAIGEYISALANSAALLGRSKAYMVWGVEDITGRPVGTTFVPIRKRVGNEGLENWLTTQLDPQVHYEFHAFAHESKPMVLLSIDAASIAPVRFKGEAYIRVGSHKKPLKKHLDHERRLWQVLDKSGFETASALDHLDVADVLTRLDYPAFFSLSRRPFPEARAQVLEALSQAGLIRHDTEAGWSITNLGALLLAKDLGDFPTVARKALRIVRYDGTSRLETLREQVIAGGYAAGFDGALGYVMSQLPEREVIDHALRTVRGYPELAVRELVANALIHQDFGVAGAGPMVEVFDDRLEISNPGTPLVPPDRFIDALQQSRNEQLARAMRLLGICEERGSGWDKVTFQIEFHQLPPPLVEPSGVGTRVVVFGPRPLDKMDKADRIRAVYQHACLRYVSRETMTNSIVRQRFGIEEKNKAIASRLIKEAIAAGVIAAYDAAAGPRSIRYVPIWATPDVRGDYAPLC
jgi:predicted HTH transcriptional regulator